MKNYIIVSLKKEIPEVSLEKEGLLRGGFVALNSVDVSALANVNCPGKGGSCSANGTINATNVNCPNVGGTCAGSLDPKSDVTNLNCTQNGGSCEGTVNPSTPENTTSGSANSILGLSMLI